MPVLINFKICDNAKECNGIEVCPTGALSWNNEKKTIVIDNSKCVNCDKCEDACMVSAIRVAKNDKEFKEIQKEIDEDPRKTSDLFIDRYGAETVHPAFLVHDGKFEVEILESHKLTVVEMFNDESIKCLLFSIPINELFRDSDIKYRRMEIKDDSIPGKYDVKEFPSLLFFKDGKPVGKIEGYYEVKDKEELMKKIDRIVSEKS